MIGLIELATTTNTSSGITGYLPSQLLPYSSIIGLVLLFIDGLLFGLAIKKALTSAILMIAAIILATFVGLAIPFISEGSIFTHLVNIFNYQVSQIGPAFYGLPIFWIIGLAIGLWKG